MVVVVVMVMVVVEEVVALPEGFREVTTTTSHSQVLFCKIISWHSPWFHGYMPYFHLTIYYILKVLCVTRCKMMVGILDFLGRLLLTEKDEVGAMSNGISGMSFALLPEAPHFEFIVGAKLLGDLC